MQLKRFELVELIVPAGTTGTQLNYPDIPVLRNDTTQDIIIVGLETYPNEAIPASVTNATVATVAQLQNIFLTLYIENEQPINTLPILRANNFFSSLSTSPLISNYDPLRAEELVVTWNKSFLTFATPPSGLPFSVLLGVYYKKLEAGEWAKLQARKIKGL